MRFSSTISLFSFLMILGMLSCVPEEEKERSTGYIESLQGIQAEAFFQEGLRGKGVKIGILDIGFRSLQQDTVIAHLRRNKQIAYFKDFCTEDARSIWASGHGTAILKYLAGIYPYDSVYGGSLARDAVFYLIRPASGAGAGEDDRSDEIRIDSALAILHDSGVRLVNLSLGFWNEFSDRTQDYSPEQIDGKSTVITRICTKWADSGMIIVNSAGNTGEYAWKTVWAPADARRVIAVGGARFDDMVFKASYSGIGSPLIPYAKPDVITYTPWGTSFTAPIITGIIACMLQKDSTLTVDQVIRILHQSASLYPYPNNYVGFGIPDARKILRLLEDPYTNVSTALPIHTSEDHITIPVNGQPVVVFRKSTEYLVQRQRIHETDDTVFVVKRHQGIPRTTVAVGLKEAYEIFWD